MTAHRKRPPGADQRALHFANSAGLDARLDYTAPLSPRNRAPTGRVDASKNDRIIVHLKNGWALGHDKHQWILLKAEICRPGVDFRHPSVRWRGVEFIASTKRILRRCMRERSVSPTPEAAEYTDAMPNTFREWYALRERADSGEAK